MENEIKNKISIFLKHRPNLYHESHVVYLMVEIRKLLDRRNDGRKQKIYSVLRFYCDWMVHISKDRITPEIKTVMHEIDRCIRQQFTKKDRGTFVILDDERDPLEKFIGMSQLRQEMESLFIEYNFPSQLINNDKNWKSFAKLLKGVLISQSIINKPTEIIKSFSFENSNEYVIKFNDNRGEYRVIDIY